MSPGTSGAQWMGVCDCKEGTMADYTFVLTFSLPDQEADPEAYLDALYEAGCDDASVGIGRLGMIGLDFTRQAQSAEQAVRSAIEAVRKAIPGAELVQAGPDLVGLTETAEAFGFSRQNMRKYATGHTAGRAAFPVPAFIGEPTLWHMAEVALWLKANTAVPVPDDLIAVATAAARINHDIESRRLSRLLELA